MPIEIRELVIRTSVNDQQSTTIQIQVKVPSQSGRSVPGSTAVRSTRELIALLRRLGISGSFAGRFVITSEDPKDRYPQQVVLDLKRAGYSRARFTVDSTSRGMRLGRTSAGAGGLPTLELPLASSRTA